MTILNDFRQNIVKLLREESKCVRENAAVAVIVSSTTEWIDTSLFTKNKENFERTVAGQSHWRRPLPLTFKRSTDSSYLFN